MFRRKYPKNVPIPRLSDHPPAELGPYGPKSSLTLWGWRISVVTASLLIGWLFGILGVLVVSAVASVMFCKTFFFVLRGDFGSDGWIFALEMETIPVTMFVLLPVWLGYALAAMLAVF